MGLVKGFKIVEQSDVIDDLINYRKTYNDKGKYLGFNAVDEFYTMQLGGVTDWTGFPGSGKTQVLMEMLLNTSLFYGWKHLVYFPDVGNKIEVIADIMHKLTGKSFNPKFDNHIQEDEVHKEITWILEHFKILTKYDVKAKLTPFEFWDMAAEIKKTDGLQTASIDSWKDMHHDYNKYGTYATYLEIALPYRNQIAEDNDIHLHTIIHPKLTEKEGGKRNAPTPYDLKGGSEWFNSGKCMVTVHRESKDGNEAQLIFGKIKPRSIGKEGVCNLFLDLNSFTYYEHTLQGQKRYASQKNVDKIKEDYIQPIAFNDNFMVTKKDENDEMPF
jgi:hypothetical protein